MSSHATDTPYSVDELAECLLPDDGFTLNFQYAAIFLRIVHIHREDNTKHDQAHRIICGNFLYERTGRWVASHFFPENLPCCSARNRVKEG